MRDIRLFADVPLQTGLELPLPAGAAQHALRVLRLKPGDPLTLFNGDGHQYPARLLTADPRVARVRIETVESPTRESPLRLTLLQSLARGEKMDWIVQKASELGVARIVPVSTERSEVKLDAARGEKRLEHWRAIAIAACEQCGRNTLPEVEAPVTLAAWLDAHAPSPSTTRWMLHPEGAIRPRELGIDASAATELAVGPEGGFGETDLATLRAHDCRALTLGPRILRTETAGIAALAALQALYGDF
ncbi:MAG: 16S rRNA (uracil(1498)-N(3))-methyltransferase [Rhodanobacteraceae bacterium]|nr:MAG: 16S rRNA (uracil(1498)-N(3))-methyltransferase [Rhodanobacteraceae bacterium]